MSVQDHGITGAVNASLPVMMTMGAFLTISLYNVLELFVIIFATFKQRKGLYFWSFIVATSGIAPHSVGFILRFFGVTSVWWAPLVLISPGWWAMVMGQSLVLYSRLNLVLRNEQRLRQILWMIIFDATVLGVPLTVLAWLASRPNAHPSHVGAFATFDKVQVGMFCVQELIISAFYIYETVKLLRPEGEITTAPLRKLLGHLILVNVTVLVFDITLLATQLSGNFEVQTPYKAAIYSIKLKIEFSVLNRLVEFVKKKEFSLKPLNSHQSKMTPLSSLTRCERVDGNFSSVSDTGGSGSRRTGNNISLVRNDL